MTAAEQITEWVNLANDEDVCHGIAETLWRRMSDPLERRAYVFKDAPSRMHYLAHAQAVASSASLETSRVAVPAMAEALQKVLAIPYDTQKSVELDWDNGYSAGFNAALEAAGKLIEARIVRGEA